MCALRTVMRIPSVTAVEVSVAGMKGLLAQGGSSSRRNRVSPRRTATGHHGDVVGQAVEGRGSIAERMGIVEIEPPQPAPGKHVIEVHPHSHEAGGRPARELLDRKLVSMRERVDPPALLDQISIDRRPRERVEVADDDEAVALAFSLD